MFKKILNAFCDVCAVVFLFAVAGLFVSVAVQVVYSDPRFWLQYGSVFAFTLAAVNGIINWIYDGRGPWS